LALKLYEKPDVTGLLDSNNPFRVTFDGRIGGAFCKQIYIRNDNLDYRYTSIILSTVDTGSEDITDNSIHGFYWKLAEKDLCPTREAWDIISAGNSLTLSVAIGSSTYGDIITYVPVWVQVTIPRGQSVQNITTVKFRITATETLIES